MAFTPGFRSESRIFFKGVGEIASVQDTDLTADKGYGGLGLLKEKYLGVFYAKAGTPAAEIGAIGLKKSI